MNTIYQLHLVFMLEEESAMHLLTPIVSTILPANVSHQFIPHEGKSDLQKSIPRKLRAWKKPNSFFIILHDQDSHRDCKVLKTEIRQLCERANQHTPLIRIVCKELESWYFGDLDAVERAYPRFNASHYKNRAQYRCPDSIVTPSNKLQKIVTGFHKSAAARKIPQYMDINNNTSSSFNHTISGIRNLINTNLNTLPVKK